MFKINTFMNIVKENVASFGKQSFFDKCDTIALLLLCLFFVDCSFAGAGKILEIGPISFRMAVAAAALLFSSPKLLKNIKNYIKNPLFYMFGVFLLYLLGAAFIGLRAGNNSAVLLTDIKGFMWLFTVPALIVSVDSKKKFNCILNSIVFGALIQVVIVLVIHFVCCLVYEGIRYFYLPMLDMQIGTVDTISDTVFRIFMRSSPYMILACSIVFFKQLRLEKLKIKYILLITLFLVCILFSFTRSLFGCAFVVFGCISIAVLLFYRKKAGLMFKSFACVAVSLIVCVGVLEYVFDASYFNFAISRTFGTPVQQSLIVKAKYEIKNIDWEKFFFSKENTVENTSDSEVNSGDATTGNYSDKVEPTTETEGSSNDATSTSEKDITGQETTTEDEKQNQINADNEKQQQYITETKESDTIREITKQELKDLIVKNPVFGNGLGACSATRNGPDEYFYYDMLARMGIVGLLLYVAPFLYVCVFLLRKRSMLSENTSSIALICGALGFWVASWFNPWMNAVLGIAVYALCCSICEVVKNKT